MITVWVCKRCGNYYASENAGNLSEKWNTDMKGTRTTLRSRCPTRACADEGIHRVPVQVNVPL